MHKKRPADEAKETDPIFKKLFEASRLSNLNDEDMQEYRKSVLEYQDVQNAISYASKQSEARGEAKGLKKGRKEGLAKGKLEGLAEAKHVMATEMLNNGIAIPLICKISGLSEEEVLYLDKKA